MATETAAATTTNTVELPPLDQDNIREHFRASLDRRDSAKADEPAKPSDTAAAAGVSPAPAAAPSPAVDAENWWDSGLQVDHGMLRNRKGEEVVKIVQNAQRKIREQGERLKELEQRSATAQNPATGVQAQPQQPEQQDRYAQLRAEYAATLYTDTDRNFEIVQEMNRIEAERVLSEKERSNADKSFVATGVSAMEAAATKIAASANVDINKVRRDIVRMKPDVESLAQKVYEDTLGGSDDPEIKAQALEAWRGVWRDSETFVNLYGAIYGKPSATVVVPTVQAAGSPPGAKTVSSNEARPRERVTLGPNRERTVSRLAETVGLSEASQQKVRDRQAARLKAKG